MRSPGAVELVSAIAALAWVVERYGGHFDLVVGGLPREVYDDVDGERETLEEVDGEYVFGKDVHLRGGSVTVETPYDLAAAHETERRT